MAEAAGDHRVHVPPVQLVHPGLRKAVVHIHPAVVVHQHPGVVEDAVVPHPAGVCVLGEQPEGALRAVRDADGALRPHNVGVEVILPVLLHHVRGIELMVRPGGVRRARLTAGTHARTGPEAVPVALPAVQVRKRRRPHLQLEVAERLAGRPVVAAVEVHPVPEHPGLAVGDILPQGQNGIRHLSLSFARFSSPSLHQSPRSVHRKRSGFCRLAPVILLYCSRNTASTGRL